LTEERAKRHIRGMFAHALSPALVDKLLDDPSLAELGGQQRELTCMFSDLAGFTSMSQRLGPQKTVRALNHYFDTMTDVVQDFGGGFLNKFLGDGIFCFFGAPVLQDDHAARAIRSAVEFQQRLNDLNAAVSAELDEPAALAIRVGLAGGEAMVGNCGSTRRMDYTAIGDCVNLASRLESANKDFHTRILIADVTWQAAGIDDLPARSVGPVLIRGVEEPVDLWEAWASPADEDLIAALATFADGVAAFGQGRFDEAEAAFKAVAKAIPGDYLSELYLALCEYGRSWSPGQPWQPSCGDGDVGRIAPPVTSS